MSDVLNWLQSWYSQQSNGEWEEQYGIRIQSLDNPGWSVHIDVKQTSLQNVLFQETVIERSKGDWIDCRVVGGVFQGYGGAKNLEELLYAFKKWASQQDES